MANRLVRMLFVALCAVICVFVSFKMLGKITLPSSKPEHSVFPGMSLETDSNQDMSHFQTRPSQERLEQRMTTQPMKKPRLIVFPVFSLETDPSQDMSHYQIRPSQARLEERMTDFTESLQYSLDHPVVARVNLMYTQDAMPDYIIKRVGKHPKLTFDRVNSTYNVAMVLEHIHANFQNELVLLTNGDVYPSHGLELVDYDLMKRKRLFYGLSRHGRREKRCLMTGQICDPDTSNKFSQDSYIFVPMEPLPEEAKRVVKNLLWDYSAQEYVLMHIYHKILKYKVLNPCFVIYMYHNHCSGLRHSFRPLFGGRSVWVFPTQSSDLQ